MAKHGRGFGSEASPEDKKKISREGLTKAFRIFRFIKPYRLQYILGFGFLVLSTGTTLSFGLIIKEVTKVLERKSTYTINEIILFLWVFW